MTAKIITLLIIISLNGGAAFLLFFMLLLGLNGFSERDAQWSLYLFLVGAVIAAILTGTAGVFFVRYLVENRNFNVALSVIGASLMFAIIGIVIDVVLMFAGFFLAEMVRTSHLK